VCVCGGLPRDVHRRKTSSPSHIFIFRRDVRASDGLRGFRVCPQATATATQNDPRKTDKRHTERFDPVEGHKAVNPLDEDVQGDANQNNGASIRRPLGRSKL